MKYMIMMFGEQSTVLETWEPDRIREMVDFMTSLNNDLTASGELVSAIGLTDSSTAKLVRLDNGVAVTTDGPYAESKESVIGFWIVDVDSEERAIEISSSIVTYSGVVELRRVGDAPPEV